MKPQVKAFQDAAAQACQQQGFPFRRFLGDYGLEDILLEADAADSSPQEIAIRVLLGCCVEDGRFNGFQAGFLAVMTYLNERLGRLGQGEQQAFRDLANILRTGPTPQAVEGWMRTHFP
jgi:hypothetical protein